eukprot:CCRYP_003663-RA/>CCRYP_003663-RA protein AED:0.27 eAED:0.27 QI:369/1/1/1/0/0/2/64/396
MSSLCFGRVLMRPISSAINLLAISSIQSLAFTSSRGNPKRSTYQFIPSMSKSTSATNQYPRPLHPGGFSLPPLVEDSLPIVTTCTDNNGNEATMQTDIILIRPPGMEELWEWYAYTKHQSEGDPSWGRVWPTALSLARFIQRSFHCSDSVCSKDVHLVNQAVAALKTSSHVVELGCGLGVAGLAMSSAVTSMNRSSTVACKRTVTFLDREPYALHCAMSSAAINNLTTAPIDTESGDNTDPNNTTLITVRAAMDDWNVPHENRNNDNKSQVKNIGYRDLCLPADGYDNRDTTILASDILYEPSSMKTLAIKIQRLVSPENGGYALITDPQQERTTGCRDSFVSSVKELGGDVAIVPLPAPQSKMGVSGTVSSSDIDIDGSLANTVLIAVHFPASEK